MKDHQYRLFHIAHSGHNAVVILCDKWELPLLHEVAHHFFLVRQCICKLPGVRHLRQMMVRAADKYVPLAVKRLVGQITVVMIENAYAHIQALVNQAFFNSIRSQHFDRQAGGFNGLVRPVKPGQGLVQGALIIGGEIVENPQVNGILMTVPQLICLCLEAMDGGEKFSDCVMKTLALGRQPEPTSSTLTKPESDSGFQLAHVIADCRCAYIQLLLSIVKAFSFHNGPENAQ
jgi:hypothetical protein